jgi:hypothetical protein
MPADVIDWVHTLAHRSGAAWGITFADCSGLPFVDPNDDDSNDESYAPDDEFDPDEDRDPGGENNPTDDKTILEYDAEHDDAPIVGVNMDETNEYTDADDDGGDENMDKTDTDDANADNNTDAGNANDNDNRNGNESELQGNEVQEDANDDVNEELVPNITSAMNDKYGEHRGAHNL